MSTRTDANTRIPGASFGEAQVIARTIDPGMGVAVARRTVFREAEDFGDVADRVALGNTSLTGASDTERARLRNAIATGALLTSGRHLQHGDADQSARPMEVFCNCASAAASFASFYLLLNGAGVGRSYDDDLMAVDWEHAPNLMLHLSPSHPDYGYIGEEFGLADDAVNEFVYHEFSDAIGSYGEVVHRVADSREGWAKAFELLEAMTFRQEWDKTLLLDFSGVRPRGAPIGGMQGRPASGPLSLMRAFINIRQHVLDVADEMPLWEQAMRVDHYLSCEVQVGGARRAARMATKSWRDPGILDFIRIKADGGLWTANNSVMVDAEFWERVHLGEMHATSVFLEATRCAYINGEPGFINGDRLEDYMTGVAWKRPIDTAGTSFHSTRYQVSEAAPLLAELTRRAAETAFPVTTNPCGEITLHVTGGYCVIADFAPVLACPVALKECLVHVGPVDLWDQRVEDSVRLAVRFLLRANTMDSLYADEVMRTNRIGVGPTGLHEWAWLRFGLTFPDLLDEAKSAPFWDALARLSVAAKYEADLYSVELGLNRPVTVTTVKPAGTTSKLFGLTEGAHLPAHRQYLRWVQFKDGDPLLADYEAKGYPIKELKTYPGMSAVGFPTVPLITSLGMGDLMTTASEATPEQHYKWLRLLEKYWIGDSQGNQVSYTLKLFTDQTDLAEFRQIVLDNQPTIKCCAVLPTRPDHELGFEYLPEEDVSAEAFAALVAGIEAAEETVDLVHLQCAGGVCPI
jgi:adenosylcobalamin-dependent ribonucleoside-triphosphate reductase